MILKTGMAYMTRQNRMTMIKKLTTTVPPKSGPLSQGLNVPTKKTKTVRLENKNGRR